MPATTRTPRGAVTPPPPGYEVIRTGRRYYPVRLHLDDPFRCGATGFTRADGSTVSFAKRTFAVLYLYQLQGQTSQGDPQWIPNLITGRD